MFVIVFKALNRYRSEFEPKKRDVKFELKIISKKFNLWTCEHTWEFQIQPLRLCWASVSLTASSVTIALPPNSQKGIPPAPVDVLVKNVRFLASSQLSSSLPNRKSQSLIISFDSDSYQWRRASGRSAGPCKVSDRNHRRLYGLLGRPRQKRPPTPIGNIPLDLTSALCPDAQSNQDWKAGPKEFPNIDSKIENWNLISSNSEII